MLMGFAVRSHLACFSDVFTDNKVLRLRRLARCVATKQAQKSKQFRDNRTVMTLSFPFGFVKQEAIVKFVPKRP